MRTGNADMNITSILAVLDGGPGTEDVLEIALAAGRTFGAPVECLHVESPVTEAIALAGTVTSGRTVQSFLVADRLERERKRKEVEEAFERAATLAGAPTFLPNGGALPTGFSVGLRVLAGHAGPEIAGRGRLFDLIVIGRPADTMGGIDDPDFEAALLDTARPVLVVNGAATDISAMKAVVAWDGSRESALALGLAVPLLARAASVEVLTIARGAAAPDPQAAARFLARHGIKAEGRQVAAGGRKPADALVEACRQCGADLVVMGAYGHSPFSEYLFGGVTRRALEAASASILVAH